MTAVIEVEGLTRRYGSLAAVDDATFTLQANTIHGLLGRNGAGKTTLMQLLTGQEFASSGTIRVFGESPVENSGVLQHISFIKESQRYPEDFRPKHVLRSAPSRTGTPSSPTGSSTTSGCPSTRASRSSPAASSRPSASSSGSPPGPR